MNSKDFSVATIKTGPGVGVGKAFGPPRECGRLPRNGRRDSGLWNGEVGKMGKIPRLPSSCCHLPCRGQTPLFGTVPVKAMEALCCLITVDRRTPCRSPVTRIR